MTNKTFLEYAKEKGLVPLAIFTIKYPLYAVKVKYRYPTSDPTDFRNRAILQLIDKGISYKTACALLMVRDPHESIFERFKNSDPGPQLVRFDRMENKYVLTPMGRQMVERIELAREGVACCFIDGFTGLPFPKDVIEGMTERFDCEEVKTVKGGWYPFEPNIEAKILELNARLNDGKERNYRYRLGLHEKAMETDMTPLGPKWMRNLSIGFFLKGTEVVRRIFCNNNTNPVSPFGWMEEISEFKIIPVPETTRFEYTKCAPDNTCIFAGDALSELEGAISGLIKKEYGEDLPKKSKLAIDPLTGHCTLFIRNVDNVPKNKKSKLLSVIKKGVMTVTLPGLDGVVCISTDAAPEIKDLGELRALIHRSELPWEEIIDRVKARYHGNWRRVLISIGCHDLLAQYDIKHFIKYGNESDIL